MTGMARTFPAGMARSLPVGTHGYAQPVASIMPRAAAVLSEFRAQRSTPSASATARRGGAQAATADAYPDSWKRPKGLGDTPRAKRSGGAGVDYPANWDMNPVDANDERGERLSRRSKPRASEQPSGAGVDYPAHWAR